MDLMNALEHAREKDYKFSSGRILGSMCTSPHPIGKKAYMKFIETNLGDQELFKGTKELEKKAVGFIADLLHAPSGYTGIMTSGGTESNITALWICRELKKADEVLIPKLAHFSFEKATSLLRMKARIVEGKYMMKARDFKKMATKKTKCGVAIAGNTTFGYIDEIEDIADFCYDENIFLHVDAAFGGFVIPFLYEIPFDFRLKGVSSMSIDAHKMGVSPIPSGFLLLRKNWLKSIEVRSKCTHTKFQASLLGTRPGASAAASYAVMHYLGKEGYKKIVRRCMNVTKHLTKLLDESNIKYVKPVLNVVAIKVRDAIGISKKLKRMGWMVGFDEENGVIRVVLMPHVKKKFIEEFVKDLKKVVK